MAATLTVVHGELAMLPNGSVTATRYWWVEPGGSPESVKPIVYGDQKFALARVSYTSPDFCWTSRYTR